MKQNERRGGKKREKDGEREAKLSGRSQRYVRRVLLSGIKKRFVIRPRERKRESLCLMAKGDSGCGIRPWWGFREG